MDYFGRSQLTELLEIPEPPAVSLYMPTHRTGADVEADPLRFRAALEEAHALLDGKDDAGILDRLEPLVDDGDFWVYQSDGLAVFGASGFDRLYRLPASFPRIVVVGPTFHTRPLIEYLQAPDRFWLLALSQKEVRLWEGTAAGLTPVDLSGVPHSLQEALGREVERDVLSFHSSRGHGSAPVYHGHGVGKDDAKAELERFFRRVDAGVRELLVGRPGPLILAAVDYYHPIYRSVSRLERLAEEGIQGSVIGWDVDRLHDAAWPIARRQVEGRIDEAVELWESSFHLGKAESDIAAAGRLAVAGRLRLLLTEQGRRLWGRLDRSTGGVEVLREGGGDPDTDAVELLDELAEITIRLGGSTLVVPPERMPSDTGVAAVLR